MSNYAKKGSWNVICMVCQSKCKAEKISRRWDGLLVCKKCYEERHPQDFVTSVNDNPSVPFSNPPPQPKFVPD